MGHQAPQGPTLGVLLLQGPFLGWLFCRFVLWSIPVLYVGLRLDCFHVFQQSYSLCSAVRRCKLGCRTSVI